VFAEATHPFTLGHYVPLDSDLDRMAAEAGRVSMILENFIEQIYMYIF
jgi:hypothetical protein